MSQVASAAANSVSSTSFVDGRSRDSFVVAAKRWFLAASTRLLLLTAAIIKLSIHICSYRSLLAAEHCKHALRPLNFGSDRQ